MKAVELPVTKPINTPAKEMKDLSTKNNSSTVCENNGCQASVDAKLGSWELIISTRLYEKGNSHHCLHKAAKGKETGPSRKSWRIT